MWRSLCVPIVATWGVHLPPIIIIHDCTVYKFMFIRYGRTANAELMSYVLYRLVLLGRDLQLQLLSPGRF